MKKIITLKLFILLALTAFNCYASSDYFSNHVYTGPEKRFQVNVPYIKFLSKKYFMDTAKGVFSKNNRVLYYWIDFRTPAELKPVMPLYMYISLEWNILDKNKNNKDFYNKARNGIQHYLIGKIQKGFNGSTFKSVSTKALKINGRAAYQLIADIKLPNSRKPIKGVFTFINFYNSIAFVSMLPVFPGTFVAAHDEAYGQILHWDQYNQVLNSLKPG